MSWSITHHILVCVFSSLPWEKVLPSLCSAAALNYALILYVCREYYNSLYFVQTLNQQRIMEDGSPKFGWPWTMRPFKISDVITKFIICEFTARCHPYNDDQSSAYAFSLGNHWFRPEVSNKSRVLIIISFPEWNRLNTVIFPVAIVRHNTSPYPGLANGHWFILAALKMWAISVLTFNIKHV